MSVGLLLAPAGCSDDSTEPAPFREASPDADAPNEIDRAELRDLEIDSPEPIVDPEAEDNPIPDDDPSADPLALDEADEETEQEAADARRGSGGLGVETLKPLNCQLPNTQRGFRNRYNPTAVSKAIGAAEGDPKKQKEIENKLGRWATTEPTPLFDGNGVPRSDAIKDGCYKRSNVGIVEAAGVCVHINFGQIKAMQVAGASSRCWIPLSRVVEADRLRAMGIARNPKPGKTVRTSYTLKSARDWGTMPRWTKGKIAKDKVGKKGADVGDYLLQHGKTANIVNFGYSTPGVGGVRCNPADDTKGLVCQNKKVVKELACDPGMHCIGPAADGPNGEKRVACL